MNELNSADKAVVINALLRLIGDDVITPLEKRDIIHEITNQLTGFNITDIVNDTNNRRRLRLGTYNPDSPRLPREIVIDTDAKALRITGETAADDLTLGAGGDDVGLPANADYVVESATGLTGTNYTNGWYRKYKSGWVEQGFRATANRVDITLPIAMTNTDYNKILCSTRKHGGNSSGVLGGCYLLNATATTIQTIVNNASGANLAENDFYPFVEIKGMFA
jgi:hypothetical protein